MAMQIQGLGPSPLLTTTQARQQRPVQEVREHVEETQAAQSLKIREAVDRLDRLAQSLNKKLSYSFNRDLNQVVVKIIDPESDKVIKELPPAELQRLHLRIQEYIGMIVDETA